MNSGHWRIGRLAELSGASPKALRLYEAQGLLGHVTRMGSYRCYTNEHLQRVRMIRLAQSLGFRLAELGWIISAGWPEVLARLQLRREQVEAEIARQSARLAQIDRAIEEIRDCPEVDADNLDACELPPAGTEPIQS